MLSNLVSNLPRCPPRVPRVPSNLPRLPTLQVTPRALTLLSSLPPPEPGHAVGLVRVIISPRRMPFTSFYHREISLLLKPFRPPSFSDENLSYKYVRPSRSLRPIPPSYHPIPSPSTPPRPLCTTLFVLSTPTSPRHASLAINLPSILLNRGCRVCLSIQGRPSACDV